jgi:cytochrome c6
MLPKIIAAFLVTLITIFISLGNASADTIAANLNNDAFNNGAAIFEANCAGCHVNGGNIVRRGKNLKFKALHKHKVDTQEAIASLVTNGKGIMSAYGDKLTPEQIADVSAYVLQKAETNWK